MKPIPMNVWPTRPLPVEPADWCEIARTRTLALISYRELCDLAGISPRVSGPDLDRCVRILTGEQHAYPVSCPDELGVAFPGYRGTQTDALRILEILAYGFFDYAARKTVRGRGLFSPTV